MLVGGSTFARYRVAYILVALAAVCLPAVAWYVAARLEWVDWPSGSSRFGLLLGFIAAGIIAFEMLLWPRKRFRGYRLGRTRSWMYWHIWLGLACLPIAVGHAGFQFGGNLTTVLLALFLLVIASGVWGLCLQQLVPSTLLQEFPSETIETEIDTMMLHRTRDAELLIDGSTRPGDPLRDFFRDELQPYLLKGDRSRSPLRSAGRADAVFRDYQTRQPEAEALLSKLREFCDSRRRYDRQARLHRWLHNWLLVHVPLSVALCVLLAVHIVSALKYW